MGQLLKVIAGLREVKQGAYTGPYFFVPEEEAEDASLVGTIELRECRERPEAPAKLQIIHQPPALPEADDAPF